MNEPSSPEAGRFATVDWTEFDAERGMPTLPRWLPLSAGALLVAFCYDYLAGLPVTMTGLDWLLVASLYMFGALGLGALLGAPGQVAHYWGQFRTNRVAVACLAFLTAFVGIGLFVLQTTFEPAVLAYFFDQFDESEAGTAMAFAAMAGLGVVTLALTVVVIRLGDASPAPRPQPGDD